MPPRLDGLWARAMGKQSQMMSSWDIMSGLTASVRRAWTSYDGMYG